MTGRSRKEQLEELLALEPDDPFLRYGLAMEFASAGSDEEAIRCLGELMQRSPDYVPAYLQAGRALLRVGQDDEARAVLGKGIAVAEKVGDDHARGEMAELLASIE
jgi:thioredoxin-like negative regulator of GroEL